MPLLGGNRHWSPVAIGRCCTGSHRGLAQAHCGKSENEWWQQPARCLAAPRQHIDEIFLIGLSKSQTINHALLSKLGKARDIPSKGTLENMTADFGAIEHPPWTKAARIDGTLRMSLHASPR